MATYLATASYSNDAFKGMVATPQDREAAARQLFESLGVSLHQIYFSVTDGDIIVVLQGSAQQMAALEMVTMASGAFTRIESREIISMTDMKSAMDTASQAMSSYTPPHR